MATITLLILTLGVVTGFVILLTPKVSRAKSSHTLELREETVRVDDYTLHYRIGGSGPILLIMHGFTLAGEQWVPFAEDFIDSHTVVIADLPGHGGSSPLPGAFSFVKSAQLMHGLLDKLGAQQAYGIGHSGGGITLLHMAAQQPERLKAMILVDAPHYFGPEASKIAREDTWERLDPAMQEWYLNLHPGGQQQIDIIFRQYNSLADNKDHIEPEVLRTLPVETLIVWGDRDPFFPLEIPLEMYRALPNAALWVIPQQGHTPLWVDMEGDAGSAERFGKIARDFLAPE